MQIDGEEREPLDVQKEAHNAVSKFRISEQLRLKLKEKGIEALLPIQAMTFDLVLDGSDLFCRTLTGQDKGKTLAFLLPILESLTNGPPSSRKTGYEGTERTPSVLVLEPTMKLACQVHADFEVYGKLMGLSSCCLYDGVPFNTQEIKLRRGVDIVIGTPGIIWDHIQSKNIDLSQLKFRVIDEADELQKRGFIQYVDFILGKVEDVNEVQTLLFNATFSFWTEQIAAQFMKPEICSCILGTNVG